MALSSSSRPRGGGPASPVTLRIHKFGGEQYLEFYRREHGLRSTVLRYGNEYGRAKTRTGKREWWRYSPPICCAESSRRSMPVLISPTG